MEESSYYPLKQFIASRRQAQKLKRKETSFILGPTIQNSMLGAHGGLGDFIAQTAKIFPHIEWVVPLTGKIRKFLSGKIQGPIAVFPVSLYEPVTGEKYTFDIEFYYHIDANNSLSWLLYNKDLMEPPKLDDLFAGQKESAQNGYAGIGQGPVLRSAASNGYMGMVWASKRAFANNYMGMVWASRKVLSHVPSLERIHPLLRRYIDNPSMMDTIAQCALSKAIVQFLQVNNKQYDAVWVQDWHFSSIAGELLLPEFKDVRKQVSYIQHLHNALYQGIHSERDLIDILDWPSSHFSKSLFNVHGQVNLLGGALNSVRKKYIKGSVAAVSKNHADELTTVERGAGLHHIFHSLKRKHLLTGVNNPITIPGNVAITNVDELDSKKPLIKKQVQEYMGLEVDKDAFLLLWSHRFIHQKQIRAVLHAMENILENMKLNVQFAFFCDVELGSDPRDVQKVYDLVKKYPKNIAVHKFEASQEMFVAAGVDATIMASYFEPFGYAPVWVALQGGLVITGANGGQLDIFNPEDTVFLDILPDINDPVRRYSMKWWMSPSKWFSSYDKYPRQVFEHNSKSIFDGVVRAERYFRDNERKLAMSRKTMLRMQDLATSDYFKNDIYGLIIEKTLKDAMIRAEMA